MRLSRSSVSISPYVIVNRSVSYNSRETRWRWPRTEQIPLRNDDALDCSRARAREREFLLIRNSHFEPRGAVRDALSAALSGCQCFALANPSSASNQRSGSVSRWWDGSSRDVYVHRINRMRLEVESPRVSDVAHSSRHSTTPDIFLFSPPGVNFLYRAFHSGSDVKTSGTATLGFLSGASRLLPTNLRSVNLGSRLFPRLPVSCSWPRIPGDWRTWNTRSFPDSASRHPHCSCRKSTTRI